MQSKIPIDSVDINCFKVDYLDNVIKRVAISYPYRLGDIRESTFGIYYIVEGPIEITQNGHTVLEMDSPYVDNTAMKTIVANEDTMIDMDEKGCQKLFDILDTSFTQAQIFKANQQDHYTDLANQLANEYNTTDLNIIPGVKEMFPEIYHKHFHLY